MDTHTPTPDDTGSQQPSGHPDPPTWNTRTALRLIEEGDRIHQEATDRLDTLLERSLRMFGKRWDDNTETVVEGEQFEGELPGNVVDLTAGSPIRAVIGNPTDGRTAALIAEHIHEQVMSADLALEGCDPEMLYVVISNCVLDAIEFADGNPDGGEA